MPLLMLLAAGGVLDRHLAISRAEQQLADLARVGADGYRRTLAETAQVLRILAQVPAIGTMQADACHDTLRDLVSNDRRIGIISVVNEAGRVACSSFAGLRDANVADRPYIQNARNEDGQRSLATEFIVSRLTGRPTIIAALAIKAGPASPVISATLSFGWLTRLEADNPGTSAWIGDAASGTVVVGGAPELPGYDVASIGPTLSATATIDVGDRTLAVVVSRSRGEILAPVLLRAKLVACLAVAATVAAQLGGALAARVLVLNPLTKLTAIAEEIGLGDLDARVPVMRSVTELQTLGTVFNAMASGLQARTRQLATAHDALRDSEEHHRLLADYSSDMITRFGPDFCRVYVSPASRDVMGYAPEELVGHVPAGIVHPDDWLVLDATLNAPLRAGQEASRAMYRAIKKDGTCVWLESHGRRMSSGEGFVVTTRDVSERKAFEARLEEANRQLEELAWHDALTGLANRRRFDQALVAEMRRAQRQGVPLALVVIDIDRFKAYNDGYGHPAGDTCLRTVAGAIESVLRRPSDMAARLGGEEFAVLLPNTAEDGLRLMTGRICDAVRMLALPHAGSEAGIVTVSAGAATRTPQGDNDQDTLMHLADQALYAAKRGGRDTMRIAGAVVS